MKGFGDQKSEEGEIDHSVEMERFRLVVNAAPNGILLVDDRGKIVLINSMLSKCLLMTAESWTDVRCKS